MILYIRHKNIWINFVTTPEEFNDFVDALDKKKQTVVGDIALFNQKMKNMLLKVMEEYPLLDLYSSIDIVDGPILSRVVQIKKAHLTYPKHGVALDEFLETDRDYLAIDSYLSELKPSNKLLIKGTDKRLINLIIACDEVSNKH